MESRPICSSCGAPWCFDKSCENCEAQRTAKQKRLDLFYATHEGQYTNVVCGSCEGDSYRVVGSGSSSEEWWCDDCDGSGFEPREDQIHGWPCLACWGCGLEMTDENKHGTGPLIRCPDCQGTGLYVEPLPSLLRSIGKAIREARRGWMDRATLAAKVGIDACDLLKIEEGKYFSECGDLGSAIHLSRAISEALRSLPSEIMAEAEQMYFRDLDSLAGRPRIIMLHEFPVPYPAEIKHFGRDGEPMIVSTCANCGIGAFVIGGHALPMDETENEIKPCTQGTQEGKQNAG